MANTSVDWISADLDAQASALTGLHTATGLPWTAYLADKASCLAAWWSTSGSVEYLGWVANVNAEYSAHTATVCAEYTTMVTAVTTAEVEYTTSDALESNDATDDQADSTAQSAQDQADATAAYQTAISTATLNLADDGDQAAYDSAVAAADLAYQQSAAAAKGAAVGTAQATDDYVDAVYGDDGDYETWQDTVSAAETAYKLATSAASETLNKNLSAHDAALEAALAGTYADALEDLADTYTPANPWATRDAADARAESDKVATEQTAKEIFEQAVATAKADFEETAANAEQTRTTTQTTALQTKMQTESDAAVTQATNQKAADDAAAAAGAGTEKKPEVKETPEDPQDATATFDDADPYQEIFDFISAGEEGPYPTPIPLSHEFATSCLTPPEDIDWDARRETFDKFVNSGGFLAGCEIVGGFIPGVGEAMDVWMLFSPDSTPMERVLAGASLGVSVFTVGFAPNAAGILRGGKRIANVAGSADEVADTVAVVSRAPTRISPADEVLEGIPIAPKTRYGTADPDALAEFDPITREISYNRSAIRSEAAAKGGSWRRELHVSAYHEHGHSVLDPVNNLVKKMFGLSDQPYFLSNTWRWAEETLVEAYGQIRSWIRDLKGAR